jgi:uncharacterized phage protein (TIGR02218 family)
VSKDIQDISAASTLMGHFQSGLTTLCRAWKITRRDGLVLGFTDHDRAFSFEGAEFLPDAGLNAAAVATTTGLSVDNSEAMGMISHAGLTEADIAGGRLDEARVTLWIVNWQNTDQREIEFDGTIGQIRRQNGAFHAELRGPSTYLNQPINQVYQRACSAVLGDAKCRVNLEGADHSIVLSMPEFDASGRLLFTDLAQYEPGWFRRGRIVVLSGEATGLTVLIKRDAFDGRYRIIELWTPFEIAPQEGDQIRLVAGCDKRFETCHHKFANWKNFRGFPDLPDEDWMTIHPSVSGEKNGGSRR